MGRRETSFLLSMLLVAACTTNPVSGRREVVLMSEEEEQEVGREAAEQVQIQMGLLPEDPLSAYVQEIGERLARLSPRAGISYQFRIVNLPEVNAFALPGGYVYVSRGLLALANSEDELANVMAHELAHVAARHAAQRHSRVVGSGIVSALGMIAAGAFGGSDAALIAGQLGGAAGIGMVAAYSRDQEREADRVGQDLAARAGWDPAAMPSFLESLARSTRLQHGPGRGPGFFDTHPTTPERVGRTKSRARMLAQGPALPIAPTRREYLARIDGLLLGDDPAAGALDDNRFRHPDLDLFLRFPADWATRNTGPAVESVSKSQAASFSLELQGSDSEPRRAADAFTEANRIQVRSFGKRRINGLRAYRVIGSGGTRKGFQGLHITWIAQRGRIFRLTGTTSMDRLAYYQPLFDKTAQSFRPLTEEELAAFETRRLEIVVAEPGETLAELSQRTGNGWAIAETAVMNELRQTAKLRAGQRIKIAIVEPYLPGSKHERGS